MFFWEETGWNVQNLKIISSSCKFQVSNMVPMGAKKVGTCSPSQAFWSWCLRIYNVSSALIWGMLLKMLRCSWSFLLGLDRVYYHWTWDVRNNLKWYHTHPSSPVLLTQTGCNAWYLQPSQPSWVDAAQGIFVRTTPYGVTLGSTVFVSESVG